MVIMSPNEAEAVHTDRERCFYGFLKVIFTPGSKYLVKLNFIRW